MPTAKLATMRKPQDFTVYPGGPDEVVQVQSDRAIGRFDPQTGVGVLNWRGSSAKYGVHLSKFLGAEDFTFPADFVAECLAERAGRAAKSAARGLAPNVVAFGDL